MRRGIRRMPVLAADTTVALAREIFGKPADRDAPFTLPRGATVGDLATRVHKDLAAAMKHARIWGPSAFDGQVVHADHVLVEGDVVEIHH